MAAYEAALKRDPKLTEAHLGRGRLNLLRGDWAAGFADYEFRTEAGEPTFVAAAAAALGRRAARTASASCW